MQRQLRSLRVVTALPATTATRFSQTHKFSILLKKKDNHESVSIATIPSNGTSSTITSSRRTIGKHMISPSPSTTIVQQQSIKLYGSRATKEDPTASADTKDKELQELIARVQPKTLSQRISDIRAQMSQMGSLYWKGTKELWRNIFLARDIQRRLDQHLPIKRSEYALLLQTRIDKMKLVPIGLLFVLPGSMALIPALALVFPSILPKTFHDPKFSKLLFQKASRARNAKAAAIMDRLMNNLCTLAGLHPGFFEGIVDQIADQTKWSKSLREIFAEKVTFESMPRDDLADACEFMLVSSSTMLCMMPKSVMVSKLQQRMDEIRFEDKLLQQEPLSSLSLDELKELLHARGIHTATEGNNNNNNYSTNADDEQHRCRRRRRELYENALQAWVRASTSSDERNPDSLLLFHSIVSWYKQVQ